MEERLSPEGAQRLRAVRDRFIEHPELYCFHWRSDCGTQGCIAGWLTRGYIHRTEGIDEVFDPGRHVYRIGKTYAGIATVELGFSTPPIMCMWDERDQPLYKLFFNHKTAEQAVREINTFLWQYGYPENEIIAEPAVELALVPDEIVEVEEPALITCC